MATSDNCTVGIRDQRQCRRPCSRIIMVRIPTWIVMRHRGAIGGPHPREPWAADRRG